EQEQKQSDSSQQFEHEQDDEFQQGHSDSVGSVAHDDIVSVPTAVAPLHVGSAASDSIDVAAASSDASSERQPMM
ncbi:hypothetical protein Dimus_008374, partial [Dionaea muscipula]